MVSKFLSLLIFLAILSSLASRETRAQSRDQQFVSGLRERRLFELAENFCKEKLSATNLDPVSRTDLTVELLRTYALHALNESPAERAVWFKQAHDLAAEFAVKKPPRGILVQLQDALTWMAEGDLAAAEIRAGAVPVTELDRALTPLRTATSALDDLNKFLAKEIPLLRRQAPAAGELSADELFSLQQHVLYHWARVCRTRSELYPPKSPDRSALLQQAQEILRTPFTQLAPEDPLADQVRLELAITQRLRGDLQNAGEMLATLDHPTKSPELRLRARAERMRAALDANDVKAALQMQTEGRVIAGRESPELDLAWLETFIAAWQQAQQQMNAVDSQARQEEAAKMARFLQTAHGPYWGRRGDQLLVNALGGSAGGAGAAVLARTADNFYRQGAFAQAAATYEKASEQAFAGGDANMAFELAFKGALVQEQRKLFVDAARRLRVAALKEASHAQAPTFHLKAALYAAQEVRQDPSAAPTYIEILNEHLKTWPEDESSGQAAVWLGQWYAAKSQPREAFAAYSLTPRASTKLAAAVPAAATIVKQWFADMTAAGKSPSAELPIVVDFFQQVLFEGDNRLPERWTQTHRDAALAIAELRLAYDSNAAAEVESLLSAALQSTTEPPPAWQQEAVLQRLLALAVLPGREREAQLAIQQSAGAAPQQLLASVERLGKIADTSPPSLRSVVARLQLQTITLLDSKRNQLPAAEQVTLDRVRAAALLLAGKRDDALKLYAQLAQAHADNGPIQEGYADALLAGSDKPSLQQALDQWRRISSRSKTRTPRWFKAKYSVALAQYKLGDRAAAKQLLLYTLETPPGLEGTGWQQPFSELLRLCEKP
jgi:hypothetical protein